MCGCESCEIVLASRSKRWRDLGRRRRCYGRTLIATVALEPRVARAIDLAHAARADGREDLVGAELASGGEGQSAGQYTAGVRRPEAH